MSTALITGDQVITVTQGAGPVTRLYKLMSRGDACVAPTGWLPRTTPSTACLSAGLIVCAKVNRRILIGPTLATIREHETLVAYERLCEPR